MVCAACGAPLVEGARFCASCGQPVARRGDERRVVTVLFADLVGFTSLSESRDPEQVKNIVDASFQRLVADIGTFGGQVDKIIGDAILALFGAPTAHEDDAERAVRAGLQMQRTLEAWAAESGADLRLRIGINTGEVLVGALRAGGDYTAMGDVVNTAQRLQTIAAPGQVVVGPTTYAATRHCVRFEGLGLVQAKGREEPVEAWAAEEALLPPGARPGRGATPLVGRENELALLKHAIDTACERRRAQLLLVMADAGMGKTRLAEEAASAAECSHGLTVLEGRCVPYGEANAWWPVAEALRATSGVAVDDGVETATKLVQARVAEGLPAVTRAEVERITNGLLFVMGYDGPLSGIEPARAREEVVRSVLAFVEGWANQRPVVLLLSDLHWADEAVLHLADRLLERMANLPVVLIGTGRHALLERWKPAVGRHNQLVLNLDPLDRTAAGALLDSMVETTLEDGLKEVLLDRAGGNPFFLEELVALLAEGGRAELPHTLRGLVAARVDALTLRERALLEDAAVLGRRGTVESLRLMAEHAHGGDPDVSVPLAGLVAKDVLELDADVWSFRSDLVREVAYGMLTKADRAKRHYGVALWLELHEAKAGTDVDRIARHYAAAAQLVNEVGIDGISDAPQKAAEWLGRALERALHDEVHLVARRIADDALAMPSALSAPQRLQFLLGRARAEIALRDLPAARADVDAADALIAEAAGALDAAPLLLVRGDLEQKAGDLGASSDTLAAAVERYRGAGDDAGLAEALRSYGMTKLFADDAAAAEAAFAEALGTFQRAGDRRGEAWALQNLAWVAYQRGDADTAEEWLNDSVDAFTEIGDAGGLGWALGLLAFVRYHQGRFADAEALAASVSAEAQVRGDRWGEGMTRSLLGSLALWTGRTALALEHGTASLALFRAMDDWYGEMVAIGIVGRAQLALGEVEQGWRALLRAYEGAVSSPVGPARDMALIGLLCAAAQAGVPSWLPEWDPVALLDEDGAELGFIDGNVAASLVALQLGQVQPALDRLRRLGEQGSDRYAGAARALVLSAAGDPEHARECALAVIGSEKATYADRVLANVAGGLAALRQGDHDVSAAMLRMARELADGTEDVLSQAVVRLAEARAAERNGAPDAAAQVRRAQATLASIGVAASGWDTAYQLALG